MATTRTTVTSDAGNTVLIDGELHALAAEAAAEAGRIEGKQVQPNVVASLLAGRHYDSWDDVQFRITEIIENVYEAWGPADDDED